MKHGKRQYGIPALYTPEGWAAKPKISHLTKNDELVGIKVETQENKFVVPVMDVRRSEGERRLVTAFEKNSGKQSKYMRPTFAQGGGSYQASHKK